jgi:hypothetical protein
LSLLSTSSLHLISRVSSTSPPVTHWCRFWALLSSTIVLFAAALTLDILMYTFMCHNCDRNVIFITLNLVAALLYTFASIHPTVRIPEILFFSKYLRIFYFWRLVIPLQIQQANNYRSGLLQAAVVACFTTYLVFSAIMRYVLSLYLYLSELLLSYWYSEPASWNCNPWSEGASSRTSAIIVCFSLSLFLCGPSMSFFCTNSTTGRRVRHHCRDLLGLQHVPFDGCLDRTRCCHFLRSVSPVLADLSIPLSPSIHLSIYLRVDSCAESKPTQEPAASESKPLVKPESEEGAAASSKAAADDEPITYNYSLFHIAFAAVRIVLPLPLFQSICAFMSLNVRCCVSLHLPWLSLPLPHPFSHVSRTTICSS